MNLKKGSLTIEASIALVAFIFVVITILSFATVYRAESIVSHATLQTSQSMAIESYYRETISGNDTAKTWSTLVKFASFLGFDAAHADDAYASLGDKGTDMYKIVKDTFAYAIADDVNEADRILEDAGIPDGLDGIDFSYSSITGSNIIINARYEVELPFSFFGEQTVTLSKSAKTKSFKSISDDNGYQETEEDET